MTIASQTSRISYTGDGATTAFAVPFFFSANSDLVVSVQDLSGNVTTEILGTDYNLTGATIPAGGTCTFIVAPTTDFLIAITRVPPLTQLTSYNNNDPFPAKSHENALDKATTVDQYLKTLIDRTIQVAPTDTPPMTTLPPAAVRALKNLSFDASGNPSVSVPVTGSTVSSVMIPVTTASTLALARTAFGLSTAVQPALIAATLPLARTALGLGTTLPTFATRALAAAATIDASVQVIATSGFYASGDLGEATYNRYTATTFGGFQSADGAWWRLAGTEYNVRQLGAMGDDTNDDGTIIQGAIDELAAAYGGGIVNVPPGNYYCPSGLIVKSGVWLIGAGNRAATIDVKANDVSAITVDSGANSWKVSGFQVFGKGAPNDTATFGATSQAVSVSGAGGVLSDVNIYGGNYALYSNGVDNLFQNVYANYAYGNALVATQGADWYQRNKFDSLASIGPTNSRPYPAWAAATAYTVGQAVGTAGYAIVCTVAGTSGGSAPTLKNYGQSITDNTVTWNLASPTTYDAILVGAGAAENHFVMCDFSGIQSGSLNVTGTAGAILDFSGCVFSGPIGLNSGKWVSFRGCEFGSTSLFVDPSINAVSVTGCFAFTAMTVTGTNTIKSGNYQIT